jgi:hypothetical protein
MTYEENWEGNRVRQSVNWAPAGASARDFGSILCEGWHVENEVAAM